MLSLRSVWEAESVIGLADSDGGRLKRERGRRFYGPLGRRRIIHAELQVSQYGRPKV